MGERNWTVNLLRTNFGSFAPADVEKSLWFFQTVSLFSKDPMTVLFIYYFSFYGNVVLSLFCFFVSCKYRGRILGLYVCHGDLLFLLFLLSPLPHVLFGR